MDTPTTAVPTGSSTQARIVRVPPRVWRGASATSSADGEADGWREQVKHEVRHHTFALLSFASSSSDVDDRDQGADTVGLHELVADHRARVRPGFFGQPAAVKRRLDTAVLSSARSAAEPALLGDTGYYARENVKEQLQVRLGPHMPWPSRRRDGQGEADDDDGDGGRLQNEIEPLFELLDGVSRRCASALVGDGAVGRLQALFDPSPEHLRALRACADREQAEGIEAYTSSSVMTLTHYFNTDQAQEPCRAHGDAGLLTLIIDPTPGLQLFDPCGAKWFDCADLASLEKEQGVRVDAVLVIGEALHRLTHGNLAVTSHRVVNTGHQRSSTVFKLRPRPDVFGPRTEADYALLLLQQPVVAMLRRREEESVTLWQEMGFDVLVHVLGFLTNERDVGRCAMVSRAWRQAADSRALWQQIVHRLARELGVDLIAHYRRHTRDAQDDGADAESTDDETNQISDYKHLYVTYVRELQANASHLQSMQEAQDYLNQVRVPPRAPSTSKVVTVGSGAVGKTSLLLAFASPGWSPEGAEYIPTVFDEWTAIIDIDGNSVTIALWDTAGQSDYDRLRPLSYPQTDCFMLCFAVNDWASLEEARDKFVPEVRRSCPTTPIILVGTKADLRETDGASSLIPVATGVELAKALGLVAYVECSAKTSRNVFETVRLAIKVPLLKDAGLLRLLAHHNAGKKGKKQKKAGDKCALQ